MCACVWVRRRTLCVYIFAGSTRQVTFTVRDDDIAEADESFVIRLIVTNGDGIVGVLDISKVTILANDNAFGMFSFVSVSEKVNV